MTIAATIAIDISGSEAAEFAGAAAVNAGAGEGTAGVDVEAPRRRHHRRQLSHRNSTEQRIQAAENPEQHNQARVAQRAGKSAGQP
jgi:hypothetical protein